MSLIYFYIFHFRLIGMAIDDTIIKNKAKLKSLMD